MRRKACALAAVLLVTGCATSMTPIKDPTVPIQSYGFSFLPPQEPGWYRLDDRHMRNTDCVMLGKKDSNSKTHTLAILVCRHQGFDPAVAGFPDYATKPEAFAEYVKRNVKHSNPPTGRMKILELEVIPAAQPGYCAKTRAKFEDHGSAVAPDVLLQDDWSYTCLHPSSSKVIIQFGISERGLPGEHDPDLAEVRDRFLKDFKFRPLE
ncbi:MAG TPA: hypothetical protein VJ550_01185 [Geomonas sp.]|nr:hypothetical protein [Geomonas sp.]